MRKAENYFAVVPEWVLFHEGLSDQAVRLYGVLRRYADQEQSEAWPSIPTLAKRMKRSDRSVQRAMKELLEHDAIVLVRRPDGARSTNTYMVRTTRVGVTDLPPHGDSSATVDGDDSATQTIASRTTASTYPRTEMFEEMVEAWHGRPYGAMKGKLTKTHRGQVNRAIKELAEIGVQQGEIAAVAQRYRIKWPEMQVTPSSIVKHWHTFTAEAQAQACKHEWKMTRELEVGLEYVCSKCAAATMVAG
jgi:hypothetical protein